jgi:hypothetical protein
LLAGTKACFIEFVTISNKFRMADFSARRPTGFLRCGGSGDLNYRDYRNIVSSAVESREKAN